jgi:hypothetical protein
MKTKTYSIHWSIEIMKLLGKHSEVTLSFLQKNWKKQTKYNILYSERHIANENKIYSGIWTKMDTELPRVTSCFTMKEVYLACAWITPSSAIWKALPVHLFSLIPDSALGRSFLFYAFSVHITLE